MQSSSLSTIAIRVHRMDAMVAFYSQAFDAHFREVDTFGLRSQFGEIDGITLKFVPIRDAADFTGYPLHQLGFNVPDVDAAVKLAVHHGGQAEGEIRRTENAVHAAIRDPDGNTIELYAAG